MLPSCALLVGFAIGARVALYGNITRTRNVSKYMIVLAVCLVYLLIIIIIIIFIRRKHNTKAVIENCGQDKLGNSTYNCPKTDTKVLKQ